MASHKLIPAVRDRHALEARFWPKVAKSPNPDGCWLWTAAIKTNGYGIIGAGGRGTGSYYAHRVAWFLATGEWPGEACVLHRCDVKNCCRPDHLFLGTHQDNMRDMA